MKKKIILIGIVLILAIVCSVVGIIINQNKQTTKELQTIQVNEVTRSVFYAPQYVAISQGYFKEKGMNIELTTGQGADAVMTAVLANQCDIGFARTRGIYICIQ